jgi:hypothetical protein
MFDFFKKPKPEIQEDLKLVDFPRGTYSAYWEIYEGEIPGGFRYEVRVMGYDGTVVKDVQVFTSPTKQGVKQKVRDYLVNTMQQYKRT